MIARATTRLLVVLPSALVLGALACGKDSPSDPSGVPASLAAASPQTVEGSAARAIEAGATVMVRDGSGRPLAGVPVAFTVAPGAGSVEAPSARTDGRGIASSGKWTLGKVAGTQRLVARVARLDSIAFVAAVAPGAPASIVAANSAAASGIVGTRMATPPSIGVRDDHGNPIAGVPVTFAVRSGGGLATGTERVTDAQGRATLGGFTLGTRSGQQEIAVQVPGVPEALLAVNAIAGPSQVVRLVAGGDQIVHVGGALDVAPRISARDAYDNPVARRAVTVRVTQGGGALAGDVVTDDAGVATLGRWAMGPAEGLNAVVVEVDGLPLTVYAKAVPVSGFDIQFRYLSSVTPRQRDAFERAAARWKKVITGDVGDTRAVSSSFCGMDGTALNELVDDLIIFVSLDSIDGAGQVLGSAGPCSIRSSDGIPVVGAMRFDRDDVAQLELHDRFGDVVLHEIGHILGLGTLWKYRGLLEGAGSSDPFYVGASARSGFVSAGGATYAGNPVPVENAGGPGTREGHWRESVLNTEVMTGFVEAAGVRMPLSLTTIGALEDLGYHVTVWGDDPYTYGTSPLLSGAVPRRSPGPDRELIEVPFPPPEVIGAGGQRTSISAQVVRPPARRLARAGPRPVQELEVRRQP